jgi:hypothetical protein
MTIKDIRNNLMTELLLLAIEPNIKCRVEKIEETHRRINAIDRYLSERPAHASTDLSKLGQNAPPLGG